MPGSSTQDAVVAFALDGRLLGAGLVDAPPHDLDRLLDDLPLRRCCQLDVVRI